MLETHDGFLWIGTRGGLARFDGVTFTTWKVGQPNSIPSDSITGLAEDADHSLWISSDGGLTRYRDRRFQTFGAAEGLPATSIWRITADPKGGVWGVTWRSELFHFDGHHVQLFPSPALKLPEQVNALLEDQHGTVWIATFEGLLAFSPATGFKQFTQGDGLAGTTTYALATGCTDGLWIAGRGGVTREENGRFTVVHIPGLQTATLLALDTNCADNALWTGSTGEGLYRVSSQGISRMRERDGLISDELWMLYFSREGSLWLGANDGLNQLSDGSVTTYDWGKDKAQSTLRMQRAQGADGELWFGCGKQSFRVSGDRLLPEPLSDSAPPQPPSRSSKIDAGAQELNPLWVRSYRRSMQGRVFVDKQGEAVLTDGTREQRLPRLPWHSVGTMLIARDGTIWVAGSEIGVRAYPPHGPPLAFTSANGLDDNNVSSLDEDASGAIWVGTLSGLDLIRHRVPMRIFESVHVTSIETSPDGGAWAGSDSGLIYVPPTLKPVHLFTQRDNLPTSVIEGVAADNDGNLWLGTQQGVVRVPKVDLLASDTHTLPVVFGTADGLRNAQSRPDSVFFSKSGDLWFVTNREVATINPHKVQFSPPSLNLVNEVTVDDADVVVPTSGPLEIPPGKHRLEIRYTLPELQIPSRIRFRYRLEGWEKDWTTAGTLRYATYTAIPAGEYRFLVESTDGYGRWRPTPEVLPIRVIPYFYQTGWFLTLLTMLTVAFIWKLHGVRVARVSSQMNARMQERARIARELHDTLLQGVLGVSMQMYAASQQAGRTTPLAGLLDHASKRLREIAEESRRAVEGLRSSLSSHGPLESALLANIQTMDLPPGSQPQVHSAGEPQVLIPSVQKEVEQIVGEAVTNAVRHSGANLIRVDIVYQALQFAVSVSDTGRGIGVDLLGQDRSSHWGIVGMRERARAIGGRLSIISHASSGTVVELLVPCQSAYLHPSGRRRRLFRRQ